MGSGKLPLFTQGFPCPDNARAATVVEIPAGSNEPDRGASSAVERSLHTRKVVGSTPSPPTGRTRPIPQIGRSDRQRFWAKVARGQPGECWPWKAGTGDRGYGRFKIGSRLYLSHRIAYTLEKGPIPTGSGYHGAVIMHSCDNPPCCNPAHLSLGTHTDNVRDMVTKGRAPNRPTALAKIAPETIRLICDSAKSARMLGLELGLRPDRVNEVRKLHGIDTKKFMNRWQYRA